MMWLTRIGVFRRQTKVVGRLRIIVQTTRFPRILLVVAAAVRRPVAAVAHVLLMGGGGGGRTENAGRRLHQFLFQFDVRDGNPFEDFHCCVADRHPLLFPGIKINLENELYFKILECFVCKIRLIAVHFRYIIKVGGRHLGFCFRNFCQ